MRYGNFRDPIGLFLRMLRSRDRAAHAALGRAAAAPLLAPIDLALRPIERRLLEGARRAPHPLLLVVGPPRSGTTLAYQILAHALPVTWFNNLGELFPRSPLAANVLFRRWCRPPAPCFESFYGNTASLLAPNDAFHVWDRWLGNDRYSVPASLLPAVQDDMRRFFDAWTTTFDRPLLNKNVRNAACVELLAEVFPEAFFVVVRRDPLRVAQSLIQARQFVQGDRAAGWGLWSRDVPAADPLECVDAVCDQVREIDGRLQASTQRLGSRAVEVRYEALCESPVDVVETIVQRLPGLSGFDPDRLRGLRLSVRDTLRLDSRELARATLRLAAPDGAPP
jgi:hypothetical protein